MPSADGGGAEPGPLFSIPASAPVLGRERRRMVVGEAIVAAASQAAVAISAVRGASGSW